MAILEWLLATLNAKRFASEGLAGVYSKATDQARWCFSSISICLSLLAPRLIHAYDLRVNLATRVAPYRISSIETNAN